MFTREGGQWEGLLIFQRIVESKEGEESLNVFCDPMPLIQKFWLSRNLAVWQLK